MMYSSEYPVIMVGEVSSCEEDCACPDQGLTILFDEQPEQGTNDCACPETLSVQRLASQPMQSMYVCSSDAHLWPLTEGFYLGFSPYAPAGPSVLNTAAHERWRAFCTPQPISDSIDQILAEQSLIIPANGSIIRPVPMLNTLTAWLHVTNACNLDCSYCYVHKTSASMSLETGLRSVDAVFDTAQKNGFKSVKLKYAGGEATLRLGLIRRLHKQAQMLSAKTGVGLKEVILSNGVRLQGQDAAWMQDSRIKLAISIDGVGPDHDRQRPMRTGGGSFAAVEHTIDRVLLPIGLKPDITITVTRLNAGGIHRAVRWALERDLPVSLNFYRANPRTLSRADLELEERAIIEGMEAAYREFEKMLPTRPFLGGLLDRVQPQAHTHTCGVGIAYVVITHEGKVAQCQMHLEQPVGELFESDLLRSSWTGPIRNLSVEEKEGCRECPFRFRCTGGCPLETYRATGRWDVASPHCQIYKTLYPQAMRLEGLRLLKLHGYLRH